MKITGKYVVVTHYDDGAGNTCDYSYKVSEKAFSLLSSTLWRMRVFSYKNPTSALSLTAYASASVVGAPPAFGTRTLGVSVAGVCTLGTNETLKRVDINHVCSDVEEHPYESISQMVLDPGAKVTTITNGAAVSVKEEWQTETFVADTNSILACSTLSTTAVSAKTLPEINVVIAETDLISREYSGQYYEAGAKALVTGAQALNGEWGGLAAQVSSYLLSGNSPVALELTATVHNIVGGASL